MTEVLRCIYDCRYGPVTFDFGVYLALADCVRQVAGNDVIDLTIRADNFRLQTNRDKAMSRAEKEWRLRSIILGVCDLLPTLRDVTVLRSKTDGKYDFPANYPAEFYDVYYRTPYLAADVLELHKLGADPRVFTATEHAKAVMNREEAYVTFTLRQSQHFPTRNVDLSEWDKFGDHVRRKFGLDVVFVPDTEAVLTGQSCGGFGSGVCHTAALDQRLRMALYEGAVMNVCSSNGPAAMMFYSKAPVLQFDQMRGGVFNAEKWDAANGFKNGGQFPWSAPNQRMTWVDSTYENLVEHFEKVMA